MTNPVRGKEPENNFSYRFDFSYRYRLWTILCRISKSFEMRSTKIKSSSFTIFQKVTTLVLKYS